MSAATVREAERPVRVDFRSRHSDRAVVFVHGFLGRADTTFGDFPQLLMQEPNLDDWDVFGVGYNSALRMDITGVWANNADLEALGYYLRTIFAHAPFDAYTRIALIAHSMGGLIAQQALVDDLTRRRVSHLFLFGTPSNGARKAVFARGLHAQARDMSEGSSFISGLRSAWSELLANNTLDLRVIAAERDAFVPARSSLGPFPESVRYVVPGTHSSIVKPKGADSLSYQIVLSALLGREPMMGRAGARATLTFLFTDIEGSTERWERHPTEMSGALARHDTIVRNAIRQNQGSLFKTVGDGSCSVFEKPANAVQAAVNAQLTLGQERFEAVGGVSVRMAVHDGSAEQRQGDYFGPTVNRVARLLSIAHGGQIVASAAALERAKAELPAEYTWRDLGVHRMKDLVDPESVFQIGFPGLRDEFPALKSLGTLPNNLPNQVSPLVGRREILAEVGELVKTNALVTLVGTGGVGKTRVALQVGADLLDGSAHGVWFVDLAPLKDPAAVVAAIAATLGVREQADRSALDTLLHYLESRRLLLILDNCEHVIDEVANAAAAILRACPEISILATSREPLRIHGEQVFRMPSLAVPSDPALVTPESALDYGAIALFVQAAIADDPNFRLTGTTAPIIAEICRRLDGIALAIELAAVRVRVLTPRRLAEKLDDRFRILTGGSRAAVPRQQTLHALIEWSHGLLDEQEQRLFRRLAIFVDGWTLDGAEAVCGDEALDERDVVDLLLSLVEKSLVVAEATETPRFRMLESVRAFALEKLTHLGEAETLAARHAKWAASLGDRLIAEWTATKREVEDFGSEIENVRAAIDWSLAHDEVPLAARAIVGFAPLYRRNLGQRAFRSRLDEVLERIDDTEEPVLAALAWRSLASAISGSLKIQAAERALELAEHCNDPGLTTLVLVELAFGMYQAGRALEAQTAIEGALRLLKEGGVGHGLYPFVLNLAGVVANGCGRYEEARQLYAQALSMADEQHGNEEVMAIRLNMAENEFRLGDPARALDLVSAVEARTRAYHLTLRLVVALQNAAAYRLALGDVSGARRDALEALRIAASPGFDLHIPILIQHLGTVAAQSDDPRRGARLCGYADAWYRSREMKREYTEQHPYDLLVTALRDRLTEEEAEALIAQGARLSEEEAVAEALAV